MYLCVCCVCVVCVCCVCVVCVLCVCCVCVVCVCVVCVCVCVCVRVIRYGEDICLLCGGPVHIPVLYTADIEGEVLCQTSALEC